MVCYKQQGIASNFAPCTMKEIRTDAKKPIKSCGSILFFQKKNKKAIPNPIQSSKAISLN